MSFQFKCPNGHLLSGDESQSGQQCVCPQCNILFIVPASLPLSEPEPQLEEDSYGEAQQPWDGLAGPGGGVVAELEPRVLHIPCPNGHELDTPQEMLGQEVLCPQCGVQFELREKDSVEYKESLIAERDRRDRQVGKMWLNSAIVIGVIIVLALIIMLFAGQWHAGDV